MLSGGERTRLAVARMLLRPSNTLLLDEPTNHLDLDSKDVLLEALEDFGGTLIFVSHDRYFVDKLATKIIEIGDGDALVYPGDYEEFLWSRKQRRGRRAADNATASRQPQRGPRRQAVADDAQSAKPHGGARRPAAAQPRPEPSKAPAAAESVRGPQDAGSRRPAREEGSRRPAAARRGARSADCRARERRSRSSKRTMAAPGFYEDRDAAQPIIDRHQALMWEVGDLMHQWEVLQTNKSVITGQICNQPIRQPIRQLSALFQANPRLPPAQAGHTLCPSCRGRMMTSAREVRSHAADPAGHP